METLPLDIQGFKSKKGASVSEELALFNWSPIGYMSRLGGKFHSCYSPVVFTGLENTLKVANTS